VTWRRHLSVTSRAGTIAASRLDMRRLQSALLISCASLGSGTAAHAADFGAYAEEGTQGLGGGVALQVNERFSARAGYSRISGDINDYEADDLEFDGDVTLGAAKLLFDWHPSPRNFRITAGAMLNDTKFSAVADPIGNGYVINGTFYPAAAIGSVGGRVDFDRFVPYIGVGFGRALDTAGRFNVLVDLGAAFMGEPDVSLIARCGSSVPAATCTQLQQDLAAEQADIEDDTDALHLWPHASVSFSWRF
jgi:hypothetical protein